VAAAIPNSAQILQRMVNAVERVRRRLHAVSEAFRSARVDHAIIGEQAAAAWVATVDPCAVRSSPAIEVLIRPGDVDRSLPGLCQAGFAPVSRGSSLALLEAHNPNPRETVTLVIAGEISPRHSTAHPDPIESEVLGRLQIVALRPLVVWMLDRDTLIDRVCVRDLLNIGLINQSWTAKLPPILAARLQTLIDTPDG
jgi:hypothetical protein